MKRQERFRRDYAPAFLRHLSARDEASLRVAYELGRRALADELSVLDLAQVHHAALLRVLRTVRDPEELEALGGAASEFFVELLATFEMAQRGFAELRQVSGRQREDARRLQATLVHHAAVERATGMLMERHGLDAEAAARQLRQLAGRHELTVDEVAARLLRRLPLARAEDR
jgi:hypothetical protein